jgi:hypothetical protein
VSEVPGAAIKRAHLVFRARQRRELLGLDSSDDAIEAAAADPDSRLDDGVPFTPSEFELVAGKNETFAAVPNLDPLPLDVVATEFSGMHFDWAATRGLWQLGFTRRPVERLAAVASGYPFPELLASFETTYSLAVLDAARLRIRSEIDWLSAQGFRVNSLGTNVLRNVVAVSVDELTSDIQAFFGDRYGPCVSVEVGLARGRGG